MCTTPLSCTFASNSQRDGFDLKVRFTHSTINFSLPIVNTVNIYEEWFAYPKCLLPL